MKRILVCLALALAGAAIGHAQLADPAALLTPADAVQASGLIGLGSTPKELKKGASGDVNIADAKGRLVLILDLIDNNSARYAQKDYDDAKANKGFCKAEIKGIGDQAFSGPDMANVPQYYL